MERNEDLSGDVAEADGGGGVEGVEQGRLQGICGNQAKCVSVIPTALRLDLCPVAVCD
jgi:hypothetical protein